MILLKESTMALSLVIDVKIVLNSMHRYQPRVQLVKLKLGRTHPPKAFEGEDYRTYLFPETTFTDVTAYQNQLVIFTMVHDDIYENKHEETSQEENRIICDVNLACPSPILENE
ncbi:hypothetical protein QYM36_006434, partial [Artemia franciscana]